MFGLRSLRIHSKRLCKMRIMHSWLGLLALILFYNCANALDNGVGLRPAMGWNSWNLFKCNVSEELIKSVADAMVETGLRDAGYEYVNLDDCWQIARDPKTGQILEDRERFPSGMKALSDYIHSKGLKFGLYSDAGQMTCEQRPGSLGFEMIDARTYADWGVDYLKYDNCYNYGYPAQKRYERMRDALNATGRPIYYSICNWGLFNVWEWGMQTGNSWRTTDDIVAHWLSFVRNMDDSFYLSPYAGKGGWNDLDMLEIGITNSLDGVRPQEYRSHFAVWAILKSPLIMGLDIRHMDELSRRILLSREVISINQDPLGIPGDVVFHRGSDLILAAPLSCGSRAVVMLNRHTHRDSLGPQDDAQSFYSMTLHFKDIGLSETTPAVVRDLFASADLGTFNGSFTAKLLWHDALALKVTPLNHQDKDTTWRPWHTFPSSSSSSSSS